VTSVGLRGIMRPPRVRAEERAWDRRAWSWRPRFEQVNNELIAFVEACSDADWRRTATAERWPVAVVAHHVGSSHSVIAGLARKIADDEALPPVSWDMIHSMNAQHAQEHAAPTRRPWCAGSATSNSRAPGPSSDSP
jgi:hypothetical protein